MSSNIFVLYSCMINHWGCWCVRMVSVIRLTAQGLYGGRSGSNTWSLIAGFSQHWGGVSREITCLSVKECTASCSHDSLTHIHTHSLTHIHTHTHSLSPSRCTHRPLYTLLFTHAQFLQTSVLKFFSCIACLCTHFKCQCIVVPCAVFSCLSSYWRVCVKPAVYLHNLVLYMT